jgi:hypothetical protein
MRGIASGAEMIKRQIKRERTKRRRQDREPNMPEYVRAEIRAERRFSGDAATILVTARPTPEVARVRAKEYTVITRVKSPTPSLPIAPAKNAENAIATVRVIKATALSITPSRRKRFLLVI